MEGGERWVARLLRMSGGHCVQGKQVEMKRRWGDGSACEERRRTYLVPESGSARGSTPHGEDGEVDGSKLAPPWGGAWHKGRRPAEMRGWRVERDGLQGCCACLEAATCEGDKRR
eukprot:TRINITY_DN11690_c1_g1_i1.p3 TRINITY_DN11690_c1_g1~~TRINITY_DN11690_c1_g1_i1.p3  ORF type:complete len:115 (-),score=30.59 TRINITY_DN11690_c1_g1_i1:208-552(-)